MTFNEQFFDASVRHQIDLLRFGSGVARKVNGILDETRADLRRQVERRLGKVTGITGASLKRLRELERAIDQTRSGAWNDVTESWTRTAVDVALEEPLFMAGVATRILPVELDLVQPSAGTLRALATTRPFQGRHLKEWAQSAQRADLQRIHSQIRIGMVQGEGARDIAARVFGVRGAMSITRHQAEAVTRTVINGVSNAAQQEFLRENSDLFDVEQYVATLDARTTAICRALDGKQFPVGKGPVPPQHVNCRSLRVAAIDGEVIGERPFKAGTEQQMLREYAAQNNLGKLGSRDDLPKGHKSKYDAFKRRRMRELTGQVPAKTTYQEWLKGQPPEIQDDILGPTRGKLFREGGLTLDRFVHRDGDELTLEELRQRNREAWERAGLGGGSRGGPERESALARAKRERDEADRARREAEAAAARAEAERVEAERRRKEAEARAAAERAARERSITARVELLDVGSGVPEPIQRAVEGALLQANLPPVDVVRVRNLRGKNGDYAASIGELRVSASRPVGKAHLPDAPGPGKLWSISTTAQTLPEAVRLTTLHELGHHAHMHGVARFEGRVAVAPHTQRVAGLKVDRVVERLWNDPNREYITDYAGVSSATPDVYRSTEYFAEAHAAYHAYPDWLRRVAPRAYNAVEEVIRIRREADL